MAVRARRIHVGQIIDSMHIGGAENAVKHLAEGLDRDTFDVSVFCTNSRGVLAEQLAAQGVPVVSTFPSRRQLRHLTPLLIARSLRQRKVDVVHTHGTPGMVHAGPLRLLGLLPPWIHTYHFGNYPLANRREMQAERFLSRRADILVAVGEVQRASVITHCRLDGREVLTVPNGVVAHGLADDPAVRAAARREFGFTADDMVVGGIAVLTRQKGVTYFLQAARVLAARHPRLRFLLVGGGPLEDALRQEARALGLDGVVTFTGFRSDVAQLLTALDVFVMASLWEAMPLALIEAMAAGRVIVATDVGDNRRILADGQCGLIIPPGDPDAIVAGVERALGDPAAAATRTAAAIQRFRDNYTVAHMVARYAALYTRLAGAG
jgi:glycosyltransferase involved in cell wall biosynthesis